ASSRLNWSNLPIVASLLGDECLCQLRPSALRYFKHARQLAADVHHDPVVPPAWKNLDRAHQRARRPEQLDWRVHQPPFWLAGWLASRNGAVEPIFAHPPAHERELRAPTSLRARARNVQFRAQLRRSARAQRAGRPRRTRNAAGASPWGFESLRLRCCNTSTYGAGPGAVLVPATRLVSRMVSRPPQVDRRPGLPERVQYVAHGPGDDRVAAGCSLGLDPGGLCRPHPAARS